MLSAALSILLAGCASKDARENTASTTTELPGLAPALGPDGIIEVGQTRIAWAVSTHCGVEHLFVDGVQWKATDLNATGIDPVPEAWRATMVDSADQVDLMIDRTTENELRVTALDTTETVTYRPIEDRVVCN